MGRRTRSTLLLAAACGAAVALTACGPGGAGGGSASGAPAAASPAPSPTGLADLGAQQIAARASAAMKSLHSVTVDMKGAPGGDVPGFHMRMDTRGDCAGTLDLGKGGAELVKAGRTVYLRYDEAFWRSQGKDGAAAARYLHGRWVRIRSTDSDYKDMASMCDLRDLLGGFDEDTAGMRKGARTTVGGRAAVVLSGKDGKATETAYVATEGRPWVLQLVSTGGGDDGTVRFSGFDRPVAARVPAAKDVTTLG
ncbi:hypothetical protein LO771_13325 [Streptacidiphilus sp. ASG 303]|uniref:hypothetical protein n=1 Tax=Streptacidiphilus sp. ASG 303 TaxID=2896847 RepID=UPI001E5077F4|nr:hypothetical protein [Streptacidiphilus sp. ASG 303]MCD0483355.1 hypothetical protein [Streptacidiphilus sp. ASG 303]